jgi:hypothetical protein
VKHTLLVAAAAPLVYIAVAGIRVAGYALMILGWAGKSRKML